MALPSAARQSLRAFQVPFPYPFLAMCALCVGRFIFLSVRASSVYFVSLAGLYPAGKLADTMCITLPNVPFPRFKKGLIWGAMFCDVQGIFIVSIDSPTMQVSPQILVLNPSPPAIPHTWWGGPLRKRFVVLRNKFRGLPTRQQKDATITVGDSLPWLFLMVWVKTFIHSEAKKRRVKILDENFRFESRVVLFLFFGHTVAHWKYLRTSPAFNERGKLR